MRSFALAAILLSLGVAALALIALNALAGSAFAEPSLREFDLMYRILGWGKYAAALFLLWLGGRAVLWREHVGWRRTVLLWSPLLFFVACSYLQWVTLGDARIDYLKRHGRWEGDASGAVFRMGLVYPLAFVVTAINWGMLRRREMRLTTGMHRRAHRA